MSGIDADRPGSAVGAQQDVLDEGANLLREAFPDIRCLRCGHESFRLVDSPLFTRSVSRDFKIGPVHFNPYPQSVVLICERCGMTEQHAMDFLRKADRPIPTK
jgi:ribosomal protein L37E